MRIQPFLKLVEIQTKVASVLPFLAGLAFAFYRFGRIRIDETLWMLLSLLCIDMATTTLNNYMDYKRAVKKDGYGYEQHNSIVRYGLSERQVIGTILVLFAIAVAAGIGIVVKTDLVVLMIGVAAFAIGILYSFGPFPISRTPFGEIFSGGFMGFLIPFLVVYIQVFDQGLIRYGFDGWTISMDVDLKEMLVLFLFSLPLVFGIANIMLANNICDVEEDMVNKRYTLPYYIGREKALTVFKMLYVLAYVDIVLLIVLKVLPLTAIVVVVTAMPVNKFIGMFYEKQVKSETFVLAVKSFVMIASAYVLGIAAGVIL